MSKNITHTFIVSPCVAKHEQVTSLCPLGQRYACSYHIVLHAEPAHQVGFASADRLPRASAFRLMQDAVRMNEIHG